jgi:hypothetical protein
VNAKAVVVESPSVPSVSPAHSTLIAVILFLASHFAMLVGVTSPEKFYFDEVHYVPAARQMLEPVMREPMIAVCIVIVAAIRLMQGWRTQFADGNEDDWYRPDLWPTFKAWHFAACFLLIPSLAYLSTFVPLYGLSVPDILEAQRRIFSDNTTTAIAGHTYMSSWPSWPFLIRPVWYLFDKIGDDRIAAVVFLGNPLILWPALIAVAISLRDWIVTRRADAFLVLAFYLGPISPGRCCRERSASSITICRRRPRRAWYWSMRSAAVRRRAGRYGPLLRSVLRASPSCCRSRPRSSARR